MKIRLLPALTTLLLLLPACILYAQHPLSPTDSFRITGKVKAERTITLQELQRYKTVELHDINTSCSPKKEERIKKVKAVLLKHILDSVAFQYEKRSMLNQFYFMFVASDGYKLLYSYNEIYNTETGNNLYVVTEMDGKPVEEMENRMLILTTTDIRGGTRNMKGLKEIVVGRVE
jgi:hypothetical protein